MASHDLAHAFRTLDDACRRQLSLNRRFYISDAAIIHRCRCRKHTQNNFNSERGSVLTTLHHHEAPRSEIKAKIFSSS
jgi:hypothetical protein